MSTEFVFDEVVLSCSGEGTYLKIKLNKENIDIVRSFVDSPNRKGKYKAVFEKVTKKKNEYGIYF